MVLRGLPPSGRVPPARLGVIATLRYAQEELATDEEWSALSEALDRQSLDSEELRNLYLGLAVDRVRLVADLLLIADGEEPAADTALELVRRLAAVDSRAR